MSKDIDKVIDDLTNRFKQELIQTKEEGFDDEFINWYTEELRDELLQQMSKRLKRELSKQIKEEIKKCEGQDDEFSLIIRVELIQKLIYKILVEKEFDICI